MSCGLARPRGNDGGGVGAGSVGTVGGIMLWYSVDVGTIISPGWYPQMTSLTAS